MKKANVFKSGDSAVSQFQKETFTREYVFVDYETNHSISFEMWLLTVIQANEIMRREILTDERGLIDAYRMPTKVVPDLKQTDVCRLFTVSRDGQEYKYHVTVNLSKDLARAMVVQIGTDKPEYLLVNISTLVDMFVHGRVTVERSTPLNQGEIEMAHRAAAEKMYNDLIEEMDKFGQTQFWSETLLARAVADKFFHSWLFEKEYMLNDSGTPFGCRVFVPAYLEDTQAVQELKGYATDSNRDIYSQLFIETV